jgi:hypothetical protein
MLCVGGDKLNVALSDPVSLPDVVGLKVTLVWQLFPGGRDDPQLLVSEKSPLVVIFEIVSTPGPTLLSVTCWAGLVVRISCAAKVRLGGDTLIEGPSPVPASVAFCVPLPALSVMVIWPLRVPVVVGVKVTLMVQLFPVATLDPHVLVWAKSPIAMMLETANAASPVFVSVMI